MRVSRAYDADTAKNAYSDGASDDLGAIGSVEDFESITGVAAGVYARYPGALANGLTVVAITENNDGDRKSVV